MSFDRFKRRYVLIPNIFSTQGPKGDKGDPGAPGTSALPISTDNVDYKGNPLTPIIDQLLYVPLVINYFNAPTNIFEKGVTLTTIQLSWGYNKSIQSQSITGTGIITPTLSPTDRVKVVSLSGITSDTIITLTADDNTGDSNPAKSSNYTLSFQNKVYWGKRVIGTIDSSFILSLTGQQLQPNRIKSFTVSTAVNEFIWFASPVAYGVAAFKANGFSGGFDLAATISFTNASGHTENYYVYKSTNDNLGSTIVDVN